MRTSTGVTASDRMNEVEHFDNLAPTNTTGQVVQHDGTDNVGATVSGTGDVVGPASSTDEAIAIFDGTTGKLLQNSDYRIIGGAGGILRTPPFFGIEFGAATEFIADPGSGALLIAASGELRLSSAGLRNDTTGGANHVLKQPSADGIITSGTVDTANVTDDAVTYAKIQNVSATDRLLGRDTAGAGNIEELTATGGIEFTGTGIQRAALTGDVTAAAGSNTTALATKHKTRTVNLEIAAPVVGDNIGIMYVGDAVHIVKVIHETTVGTCDFNLEHRSARDSAGTDTWSSDKQADTSTTSETTFTDDAVPADNWIVFTVSAVSTDCGVVYITVEVTVD